MLVLSQIGDIAGRGNFILASHQRPRRRERARGLTLHAFSFHLHTFKLRHILSFISSFSQLHTYSTCRHMHPELKEKTENVDKGYKRVVGERTEWMEG